MDQKITKENIEEFIDRIILLEPTGGEIAEAKILAVAPSRSLVKLEFEHGGVSWHYLASLTIVEVMDANYG